jgi:hypothetical protein
MINEILIGDIMLDHDVGIDERGYHSIHVQELDDFEEV